MRTVIVKVDSLSQGLQRFKRAWKTGSPQGEYVTFDSLETLLKTLTSRRWELIRVLQEGGRMSLRELARRLGRDVKRVHEDIHKLIEVGLVEQGNAGVYVPYDEIRAEFNLRNRA
ncbi:MAG: winged helix-turn-helix transcriptional regulator [Gammaproteobacteria bacterium]